MENIALAMDARCRIICWDAGSRSCGGEEELGFEERPRIYLNVGMIVCRGWWR